MVMAVLRDRFSSGNIIDHVLHPMPHVLGLRDLASQRRQPRFGLGAGQELPRVPGQQIASPFPFRKGRHGHCTVRRSGVTALVMCRDALGINIAHSASSRAVQTRHVRLPAASLAADSKKLAAQSNLLRRKSAREPAERARHAGGHRQSSHRFDTASTLPGHRGHHAVRGKTWPDRHRPSSISPWRSTKSSRTAS